MVWILFKLRAKQAWRYVLELGWLRAAVLLVFVVVGWMVLLRKMILEPIYAPIYWGVALLSALGIHLQRNDRHFLGSLHPRVSQLFFFEYALLSLPFFVLVSLSAYGYLVPLGFALLAGIAFTPLHWGAFAPKHRVFQFPFLPTTVFEWRSGLRKEMPQFFVLLVLGFVFLQVFWVLPLVLIAMGLLAVSFYFECEPLAMLNVEESSPRGFLWEKIKSAIFLYSFMVLLPVILHISLHPAYWFLPVYAITVSYLVLFFAILLKYALYEPSIQLRFNGFFIGLMVVSFLLPFLFPIPFIMIIRYNGRAVRNLRHFLGEAVH